MFKSTFTKLMILGIGIAAIATSCANTTQGTDEQVSKEVLSQAQEQAGFYKARNFTLRRTVAKFQQVMDEPDLTGYVVVPNPMTPGVSPTQAPPLMAFKTFGSCFDDSTQMTNPMEPYTNGAVIPLPEPGTGLFTGNNGSGATNCVTEAGTIVRIENPLIYSTAPIKHLPPIYEVQEAEAKFRVDVNQIKQDIKSGKATQAGQ